MHFSQTHPGSAGKATKIAVVAALHLALGSVLVTSMHTRISTPPPPQTNVTLVTPTVMPPPLDPIEPQVRQEQIPTVVVPPVVVNIQDPPVDPGIHAVIRDKGEVQPQPPGPVGTDKGEGTVKPTVTQPPAMRSAVLADAKNCVTPDYPARAARNGETGTVTLALLVGTNGSVINSRILTSSGSRELDRAAQSALSSCAFQPAMEGGVAQEGWARISYVWTLD